jgi:hypothetical protein
VRWFPALRIVGNHFSNSAISGSCVNRVAEFKNRFYFTSGCFPVTFQLNPARGCPAVLLAGFFGVFFVAGSGFRRIRWFVPLPTMKPATMIKCLHCHEELLADCRNLGRQRFCHKPDCRRASKASSQRQWRSRPENRDYFRGSDQCERVRRWRQANPDYWRSKRPPPANALQDTSVALQEICIAQPALIIGLIAVVTGLALQDDIAACIRSLLNRGRAILRMVPGSPSLRKYEIQSSSVPGPVAARASPG